MLEQLCYRFTSYNSQREKWSRTQGVMMSPDAIRNANNHTVDRLKSELELAEESTIADLRAAAERLAGK